MKTINARVRSVTKSAEAWSESDLILMRGEIGIDITNNIIKIGNGVSLFSQLPAINGSGGNDGGGGGSGGVAVEVDPTVPLWAKAANKPSYNTNEITLSNQSNESASGAATQSALNAELKAALSDKLDKKIEGSLLTAYTHAGNSQTETVVSMFAEPDTIAQRDMDGRINIVAGTSTTHAVNFTQLSNKVDKIPGMGLSTNDYTTSEKTKLAGLNSEDYATAEQGAKADTALQSLPIASSEQLGAVMAEAKTTQQIPVFVDTDGKLFVQDEPGMDAYQIAVNEFGFQGTREEWVASLKGQDGVKLNSINIIDSSQYTLNGSKQSPVNNLTGSFVFNEPIVRKNIFYFDINFEAGFDKQGFSGDTWLIKYRLPLVEFFALKSETSTASVNFEYTPKNGVTQYRTATIVLTITADDTITFTITYDQDIPSGGAYPGVVIGDPEWGIAAIAYELGGGGIAPRITPDPYNNELSYKLQFETAGRNTLTTDNLKGPKGTQGNKGNDSVLEAIDVLTTNFIDSKLYISYTDNPETQGLYHHIAPTSNILAFKQVYDEDNGTWQNLTFLNGEVKITEDGLITIDTTPFDGKILLTSGSNYSTAGGGGAAEHKLLQQGTDYAVSTFLDSMPFITFTETLDVPLYFVYAEAKDTDDEGNEMKITFNTVLKRVPYILEFNESEEPDSEMIYIGLCDEVVTSGLFSGIQAVISSVYIKTGENEGWVFFISAANGGFLSEIDKIEIIRI